VETLRARVPNLEDVARIVTENSRSLSSTDMGPVYWVDLAKLVNRLVRENPDLDGIVITHGTATLEETAYFLHLRLSVSVPVVLVGAQRPISALSSDAPLNLVNEVRVAASPDVRGLDRGRHQRGVWRRRW